MQNLLSDQPVSTGQVLENMGYSKGITETPSMVINTPSFQQALQEVGLKEALIAAGVDSKKIAEKVNLLLEAKDKEGVDDFNTIDKGLRHATAIHGVLDLGIRNPQQINTYNFIFSADVQSEVKKLEDAIKAKLIKHDDKKD